MDKKVVGQGPKRERERETEREKKLKYSFSTYFKSILMEAEGRRRR